MMTCYIVLLCFTMLRWVTLAPSARPWPSATQPHGAASAASASRGASASRLRGVGADGMANRGGAGAPEEAGTSEVSARADPCSWGVNFPWAKRSPRISWPRIRNCVNLYVNGPQSTACLSHDGRSHRMVLWLLSHSVYELLHAVRVVYDILYGCLSTLARPHSYTIESWMFIIASGNEVVWICYTAYVVVSLCLFLLVPGQTPEVPWQRRNNKRCWMMSEPEAISMMARSRARWDRQSANVGCPNPLLAFQLTNTYRALFSFVFLSVGDKSYSCL